jgi:hypothetical protein
MDTTCERERETERSTEGIAGFEESEKNRCQEGAEKRKDEPNVRDDWCLPISAASRK